MHLLCPQIQVFLPSEGFRVFAPNPVSLLWDCHHGDTFVLKVEGLAVEPFSGEPPAEPITLEVSLAPFMEVLGKIETFAAHHNLALSPWPSLPEEVQEPLTLAACHLPQTRLFVFCEQAALTARATPEGQVRLAVAGDFKSRKIPCQETDLVLHLERANSTRLLSYCFTLVRSKV
jgi:hypothetical protein